MGTYKDRKSSFYGVDLKNENLEKKNNEIKDKKNPFSFGPRLTLSSDTAKNPANEDVKYITSMTFPLDQKANTYKLGIYVDSNVMGTQIWKKSQS